MLSFRQSPYYKALTDDRLGPDDDLLPPWPRGLSLLPVWLGLAAILAVLLGVGFLLPRDGGSLTSLAETAQLFLGIGTAGVIPALGSFYIRSRYGGSPPLPLVVMVMLILAIPNALLTSFVAFRLLPLVLDMVAKDDVFWLPPAVGAVIPLLVIGEVAWRRHVIEGLRRRLATERKRTADAHAARRLAELELRSLQAQIEPHFLYNTLASVQQLLRKSPEKVDELLDALTRYLRAALPRMRNQHSTLAEEFELCTAYLEVMRIRFGGRLAVSATLPAHLAAVEFPPLILQTLVENAVKHGVEPKAGPVHIHVEAGLASGELWIRVTDDGIGLGMTQGMGVGLRNTRERLKTLYGEGARLELAPNAPTGVSATVLVPQASLALVAAQ